MTEISNEEKKEQENRKLSLIPKIEDYIEYVIVMLIKIPRTEKFSIGTETKVSMYKMINNVLHLYKCNTLFIILYMLTFVSVPMLNFSVLGIFINITITYSM